MTAPSRICNATIRPHGRTTASGPQPTRPRGIDEFIGLTPGMIGRGHGAAVIRSFVDGLLAAATPRVLTDPDPANARAIRACEKAGFRRDRLVRHSGRPRC